LRDYILFHVNGKEHRARGREVFTTLSNWLRYDVGATGTKIVCEEGDCGACTVLVAGDDWYAPVNSCIQSLWQLDGASIVTVEGLSLDGQLNPVQEAMVQCHGAQCGYCTPGFVVAMAGLFEGYGPPGACSRNEPPQHRGEKLTEKQVRDGLTGNLCRCTGYEPIIKAALAIDETAMPGLATRYGYGPATPDSVLIEAEGRTFFAPATLKEAIEFKASHPGCTIVQGGTDVGVWINKRGFAPATMLSLRKIAELTSLTAASETSDEKKRGEVPGTITAGANVTLADFERFIEHRIPQLFAILNIFGSPQIKNAGTLVGNIANGSPIGDTLPFLFVAGAELELAGLNGTRRVPVESFYLGYRKLDLRGDEIITRVIIPPVSDTLRLYKVSRRKDLDISAFTAAIRLRIVDHTIADARVAYGGVGPIVIRMPKTEQFLAGKPLRLETFERAGSIAASEVSPISDVRGSREYRLLLAENVMAKCGHELIHG
jgi:xanthine dehydrogenase small subunit